MLNRIYLAAVLLIAIAVENYLWPSWVVTTWYWTVGWLPSNAQHLILVAVVGVVVVAAMVSRLTLLALVLVALWPLTALKFGQLDRYFYQLAQNLASDPGDFHQVSQIFNWLHYGVVFVGAGFVLLLLVSIFRPRPRRRYEPKFK